MQAMQNSFAILYSSMYFLQSPINITYLCMRDTIEEFLRDFKITIGILCRIFQRIDLLKIHEVLKERWVVVYRNSLNSTCQARLCFWLIRLDYWSAGEDFFDGRSYNQLAFSRRNGYSFLGISFNNNNICRTQKAP